MKSYVIDEIRASAWTVRLRDLDSGQEVEVPLTPGTDWPPFVQSRAGGSKLAEDDEDGHALADAERELSDGGRHRSRAAASDREAVGTTSVASEPPRPAGPEKTPEQAKPRRGRPKKNRGKESVPRNARAAAPESPATAARLPGELDPGGLSPEDAEAWGRLQKVLRHARGRKGGKKGELGWEATTDAGRSGLLARSGGGAYKILHAGAEIYALFYEWDGGKYRRLACGGAEDLMNIANERAQNDPPEAPLTNLSLELARLHCGTPAQKAAAAQRLEPVFQEVDEPRRSDDSMRSPSPPPPAADPELDAKLTESLEKALEEMNDGLDRA